MIPIFIPLSVTPDLIRGPGTPACQNVLDPCSWMPDQVRHDGLMLEAAR